MFFQLIQYIYTVIGEKSIPGTISEVFYFCSDSFGNDLNYTAEFYFKWFRCITMSKEMNVFFSKEISILYPGKLGEK